MEELNLTQKFDAVLDALYEISGKHPTFRRIIALLYARNKKVDAGEVWDIMVKMQRDNLLHPPEPVRSKKPNQNRPEMTQSDSIHLITFEGKLLKERGGLKGKDEREKTHWTQTHPIAYAIITGLAAATLSLAVGLILWQVDKQSDNKETQEIKQTIKDANHRLDSVIEILNNIPDSLRM